jgi:hypothetical protein
LYIRQFNYNMHRRYFFFILLFLFGSILFLPFFASAQTSGDDNEEGCTPPVESISPMRNPEYVHEDVGNIDPAPIPPKSEGFTNKLQNPLGTSSIDSLPKLIEFLIDLSIKILSPLLVLYFIWTGFIFVRAQGNPTEIGRAKHMLLYGLIGGAVILGAKVIALAIAGTIGQL